MGLRVTHIAEHPSYFLTGQTRTNAAWIANVLYETEVENLDITPSNECIAVRYVNKDDIQELPVFPNVKVLADMFDPSKHK
jgi:hypothetical protein